MLDLNLNFKDKQAIIEMTKQECELLKLFVDDDVTVRGESGIPIKAHDPGQTALKCIDHKREKDDRTVIVPLLREGVPGAYAIAERWIRWTEDDPEYPHRRFATALNGEKPDVAAICKSIMDRIEAALEPLESDAILREDWLVIRDFPYEDDHEDMQAFVRLNEQERNLLLKWSIGIVERKKRNSSFYAEDPHLMAVMMLTYNEIRDEPHPDGRLVPLSEQPINICHYAANYTAKQAQDSGDEKTLALCNGIMDKIEAALKPREKNGRS